MKNFMKKKQLYALLMIFTLTASGCKLAPKEEVLPDAPVIPVSAVEEYKKAEVIRGDLIDSVTVDCTYNAFQSEILNFQINGLRIDHVYIEEGDSVKKGEVLADLEMNDINRQIVEREDNIELLNLKLSQQKELKKLAISNLNKLKGLAGYNSLIDSGYNQTISGYDNVIAKLHDDLFIEQERYADLQEDIKKHQIIAGMDGIVSYIAAHEYEDKSDKKTSFITLYDPDTMMFVTNGKNSELFTPGQKVDITVADNVYPAVVLSAKELKEQYGSVENGDAVYLQTDNSENSLQKDDTGKIIIINNELKNVLYLPSSAVHNDNNKSIVYVEDDTGFKSIKEVKIGPCADRKVEIISGLNEGDSVILE
jgi:RND family efflux transporter MFP subunit